MLPTTHDIEIFSGESITLRLELVDDTDQPLNHNGFRAAAKAVRYSGVGYDANPYLDQPLEFEVWFDTLETTGILTIHLSPEKTQNIVGGFKYEVRLFSGETYQNTVLIGFLNIKSSVIRLTP